MSGIGSTKNTLLIAASAVAIYFLLRGVGFINSVEIKLKKIRFAGSFLMPEMFATFTIINPTDVTVNIDTVEGNLLYKQLQIASVSSNTSIQISSKQGVDIELKLLSKITDLITVISSALKGDINNNILFKGYIVSNGIPIPVNTILG